MPVATTYPGVYIEEIPSGVHTITGVGTSITAFVGYTSRGRVNQPVHIFSYADFERAFGGLSVDSPLSYCVKHFFQNGGTEAYIVRAALGAVAASVTLLNATGGSTVFSARAASEGTWGNNLQIDVDYDTSNPSNLFNLRVTELIEQNGQMVPGPTEVYRNLSLNSADPMYVIDTVNSASQLLWLYNAVAASGDGISTSGVITPTDLNLITSTQHNNLAVVVNGQGPYPITIVPPAGGSGGFPGNLSGVTGDIVGKINGLLGAGTVKATPTPPTGTISITAPSTAANPVGSIHFVNASSNDASALLKLGLANGGTEVDGAATSRPAQTGTVGSGSIPTVTDAAITIDVLRGTSTTPLSTITLPIWGAGTHVSTAQSWDDVASDIQAALASKASTEPYLVGAKAQRIGNSVRILPGWADANIYFKIKDLSGNVAATLGFTAAGATNVARYAPGIGVTVLAQTAGNIGGNGSPPGANELTGHLADKSGMYALENVDLFNILVMPDATAGSGLLAVLTDAIAYCTKRRAFMVIDAPETVATFAQAQTWIGSTASPLRSRNAAIYFPRLREPDPMMSNVVRSFPAAGAVAGLYARTDADRGVWKAPAGTSSMLVGATGLSYTLTDGENGTLNPLGLNCLRTFPVYGTVSWGSRTGRGADALADEYKYVPVRRLALFLEESLYRGTQWAVFEPNDEPLWAQIRLNLGAFMHVLFAQGAFQGRTPREAYFVKCDKETTTQNDIDLGRVNIVVGFAPLKPAEFVIIQIQQIAGAIQT